MVLNRNLLFQGSIFRCYLSFRESILSFWPYKQTANFCSQTLPKSPSTPKGGDGQSTWILVNSNEEGSFRSKARMAGLRQRAFCGREGKKNTNRNGSWNAWQKKQRKGNMAISGWPCFFILFHQKLRIWEPNPTKSSPEDLEWKRPPHWGTILAQPLTLEKQE